MKLLLSCVSVEHTLLKQEWAKTAQYPDRPSNVLGRPKKLPEKKNGIVCIIDETGSILESIRVWMPTGMLVREETLLVASPWGIHSMDRNLSNVTWNVYNMPWFNGLHTIAQTRSGFLVTSTGLDLLLEFDQTGKLLWSWWDIDHGLNITPSGLQRFIKKSADHRRFFYDTPENTTHINSAVELENGDILATLFHQGMVIYIQRASGQWNPLVENLNHPHFVRLLDGNSFTVADSAHGKALLLRMLSSKEACIEQEISLDTDWLADCFYDKEHECWYLLDAHNSQVVFYDVPSQKYSHLSFDSNWRMYSVERL